MTDPLINHGIGCGIYMDEECDCGVNETADLVESLRGRLAEAEALLRRYYLETPLGHQPPMLAHEVFVYFHKELINEHDARNC